MTIKDIANICQVSPSTVSKILHGKDQGIREETRRRVLSVIKEYQYVPYSKAIKNAAVKSSILGVLVAGSSPENSTLIYEIERCAKAGGYSILLCNTQGEPKEAEKCLAILEGKGVDGMVSLVAEESLFQQTTLPVALLGQKRQELRHGISLYYDPAYTGYLATEFLLEKGHRKIGCVLAEEDHTIEAGYIRAHHHHDTTLLPGNICRISGDNVEIAVAQCLSMDITAIVCSNTKIAACVYARLYERGDTVPGGLSVISVRDGALATMLTPALSAVHVPYHQMAQLAVEGLIECIESKHAQTTHKKLTPTLLERESVRMPAKNKQGGKIVVVGSMNMDCMIFMDRVPLSGETVLSGSTTMIPGGKGSNQAMGAGKLGGLVYMIGCLGNDSDGKELYNSLAGTGVKMDAVEFDASMTTGKAYIQVPASGESTIVVYPGANKRLDRTRIGKYKQIFDGAKYCLLSLEIPEEAAQHTVRQCMKQDVEVIVKPSAVEEIRDEMLRCISYLIPNEKELAQIVPGPMSLEEKVDFLLGKGVKNMIVTLGPQGCYFKNAEMAAYFPAADFHPVDTTGAADAFISALAVFLSEGTDIVHAIGFATYAAGISITRSGVQPALADRRGLDMYKDEIYSHFGPVQSPFAVE